MLTTFIIAFSVTLGLSLFLTPLVIKFASIVGAMDKPNERKVHKIPTPRLGGVAIFISFMGGVFSLYLLKPDVLLSSWIFGKEGVSLFVVLLLVLCLGVWDDIRSLKPGQKFVVQLALSVVMYLAGFSVSNVTNIFGVGITSLGLLDFPLTVLWIVGVTNAINLIDGLDGLATGISIIAAITILPLSILRGDMGTAILSLLLASALIGFLRYNFNPAKIFLGDSGSLFLGFLLSVLSVKSSTKSSTGFALLVPILALGLPIMDTLLSMIRRFLRSFLTDRGHPEKLILRLRSMFQPDSSHIHHRLISRGLSHRNAVIYLYIASCILGAGAFAITISTNHIASLILIIVGTATIIGIRQLKYKEMAVLQNGVLLPLYDKPIMNIESFQIFFDLAVIVGSFTMSHILSGWFDLNQASLKYYLVLLTVVVVAQFLAFWSCGMYKRSFQISGIGDILRTMKGIGLAVIATSVILFIFSNSMGQLQIAALIIDFFFLTLFAVGVRVSLRILMFLSFQGSKDGKKVVIYGADANGIMMLDRMIDANISSWTPVGFLDDNPALEGKMLNGYPIFGSHWKLHKLIKENTLDEIVICSESIKAEALRRMKSIADKNNIPIKRIRILFEDYHEEVRETTVPNIFQLHNSDIINGVSEQQKISVKEINQNGQSPNEFVPVLQNGDRI